MSKISDAIQERVKRKGDTVRVTFGSGYNPHIVGRILAKVTNTGNGYIAKFPSYSSCEQENYACLDYSEAYALWLALGEFFKDQA